MDWEVNRDRIDGLFCALGTALASSGIFFRHKQDIVYVERAVGPVVVHERNLAGFINSQVELRLSRETDAGLLGVIVEGRTPPTITYTPGEAELEKRQWDLSGR